MRKFILAIYVLSSVMGSTLIAGNASAVSTVSLQWCADGFTTGHYGPYKCIGDVLATTISPTVGDLVMLKIVLQGDSPEGIGGVFVSILFDTAELDFVSATEHSGPPAKVSMGNRFAPLVTGVTADEGTGAIFGFDSQASNTGCIGCTVTLGSVVFEVTALLDSDGPNDVRLAVLPNGIDGIFSAYGGSSGGAQTTENFGNAEILPEPTTGLLIVGGLLCLGYTGRQSAR